MSNPKLLLLGEHPLGSSGNSGMMHALLANLDISKLDVSCLVAGTPKDPQSMLFKHFPISIVDIGEEGNFWGHNTLVQTLEKVQELDVLFMVGIDIWRYQEIYKRIIDLRDRRRFRFGALFPYDLNHLRDDWVEMIRALDFPCVYSQYGYEMLKDHVSHIRYFRPYLHVHDIWIPFDHEKRNTIRRNMFQGTGVDPDVFVIGFIGVNQFRKDPQKLLLAFKMFHEDHPKSVIYIHTEKSHGVYNLAQYALDIGLKQGTLLSKPDGKLYPITQMPNVYNAMDVLVNCSLQEGLSWTVIESYLCGTPVIMSDTTAHKELKVDDNMMVPCNLPSYIPVKVATGQSWVEADSCSAGDIYNALCYYYDLNYKKKNNMKGKIIDFGKCWVNKHGDINELVKEMTGSTQVVVRSDRKNSVLFAQHSAAGDVFMTTRCLKGLKERHPDIPLFYMTQNKYHDIVRNHPLIEAVLDWDEWTVAEQLHLYTYNPHGDIILPGHWGRNSNSILSDFYWKILRVRPGDFYVNMSTPSINEFLSEEITRQHVEEQLSIKSIAVVHTTGGDSHFRRYEYMKDVCEYLRSLGMLTVQLGGPNDYPAWADCDLRGKLSYSQSNWVMSRARLAVTVDSYMSHLAGALGVDQVCLFGSGNYNVVQPKQMGGHLICMVPDYVNDCKGLGPCSASVRDCPVTCTGIHDPRDVCIAVASLLSGTNINPVIQKEGKL